MELEILLIFSALLAVIVFGLMYFLPRKPDPNEQRPRPAANRIRDGAPRRAQMVRNRGARLRANAAHHDSDDGDEELAEEMHADKIDEKMGAKKRAKMEAKAEKKAQREAEDKIRQEKKKREQQADDERQTAEERERAEEKRREEEERKAREEKERREYEEYLKMKEMFSVEEEGYEEGEEGDAQNLLQEFVSYIKNQKVVLIEDLAAHFKLKTQAAIDRIKDLQSDNILSGVIDDRGKFIYVSAEEMEAVAKFIRQRGRVSIQELAENSNQLINLTPVTKVN